MAKSKIGIAIFKFTILVYHSALTSFVSDDLSLAAWRLLGKRISLIFWNGISINNVRMTETRIIHINSLMLI